tara:strand:- start:8333 stop:9751 length:1419 start_codon:yes stop_codon:yes gene_type:complete
MSKSKKHDLLYIMNPRCGWCKKADPVVEELVKEGYDITTLDMNNPENAERANAAKSKHNAQCGTPLFLDVETGNMVCGFREKDILEKWAKGEEVPAPPKPPANVKKSIPTRKLAKLEYIWVDGTEEKQIRSKTRYITINFGTEENPLPFDSIMTQIPQWTFDGSSTGQSETNDSDLILKPVRFFGNPFSNRQQDSVSYIVLCEVFNADDTPHETNTRAKLREIVDELSDSNDFWFGVEQEYVFMDSSNGLVHGWEDGEPEPQGDYYCGNGGKNIINSQRQVVETHAQFCISSGINVGGTNAEVMKSQWEYQVGPAPSISLADQLWVSRHILNRLAEVRDMYISYEAKPVSGDWNGSGCHINISTKKSRTEGGKEYIENLCSLLEESHDKHIKVYGSGNENRLTGKHETANIDEFTWSECDRTVSVRVPLSTVKEDFRGHIEDRRPSANVDPYEAFSVIIDTLSVTENELVEA